MHKDILVLNAGSSTIKLALYPGGEAPERVLYRGEADGLGGKRGRLLIRDASGEPVVDQPLDGGHEQALETMLHWLAADSGHDPGAVGHRVVHGGTRYMQPVRLTPAVIEDLERLDGLAPLHQPHNLAPVRMLERQTPDLPQVACFDTAFHASQPWEARRFALPRHYTDAGIVRYGFHGLSYEYVSRYLCRNHPRLHAGRVLVAHLGNGASMCALHHGHSIATTMGFTALDGLPMGQRCGSLDPGVILYLMDHHGMDLREVEDLLYHRSGLLGMSGISHDMRTLLASDEGDAAEAIQVYCYRAAREAGSLAAALRGVDGVVFTGGVGQHAAAVRAAICERLDWLGVRLDQERNDGHAGCISADDSIPVLVIATDEERIIAEHTRRVVSAAA